MSATSRYLAGGMSGTSADGVDIAIVRIDGRGLDMTAQLVVHHHRPYNEQLRRQIFAFRGDGAGSVSHSTLRRLAEMGREISLTYAAAVNEALAAAHLESKNLAAVAAHGQTLFHDPPNTIQWLDPSLIAAEVGCAVVSDFRRADLAAGGQGAPLVPFADFILFRHATKNRVLLNLGGIANITWIPAGATIDQVLAFDTGPANCVLDHLARQHDLPGGFDRDGALSLAGTHDYRVAFLSTDEPYFWKAPPKSTDGPQMIALFVQALRVLKAEAMSVADQLATACVASARAISQSLHLLPNRPDEIIVSGGGTKNARLMQEITEGCKLPMRTTDDFGVSSDAKEAIAFALLGAATLDGVPSNVPSVTGAKRPVVLGSITPRP